MLKESIQITDGSTADRRREVIMPQNQVRFNRGSWPIV
jgi:hypothetical protein